MRSNQRTRSPFPSFESLNHWVKAPVCCKQPGVPEKAFLYRCDDVIILRRETRKLLGPDAEEYVAFRAEQRDGSQLVNVYGVLLFGNRNALSTFPLVSDSSSPPDHSQDFPHLLWFNILYSTLLGRWAEAYLALLCGWSQKISLKSLKTLFKLNYLLYLPYIWTIRTVCVLTNLKRWLNGPHQY